MEKGTVAASFNVFIGVHLWRKSPQENKKLRNCHAEGMDMKPKIATALMIVLGLAAAAQAKRGPLPEDMFALKEIGNPRLSPDGTQVVYTVSVPDRTGNRYTSNLWIVALDGKAPAPLTTGEASDSSPRWSPDGRKIAFASDRNGKPALWVIDVATREMRSLADWERSNAFISKAGEAICWSPDSRQIAFVAAPKAGTNSESTDPRVITRLQYKTRTSLSDNKHSHIFVVSLEDGKVRQLTRGNFDEHSIAWSPHGDEIAFLSNRLPDPDATLNYDIFTIEVAKGIEHRLTQTPGVEMSPAWSPDGSSIVYTATKRKITTIDSVAEDAHVWVLDRVTLDAKEISAALDRRAASPQWSADGSNIYFIAGDQGSTRIYRVGNDGGAVSPVFVEQSQLGSLTVGGRYLAFTRTDETSPAELWAARMDGSERRPLTSVNKAAVSEWNLAKPEEVRFKSFDGTEIQGWLVRPQELLAGKKCPMILSIHGGPHGMFGVGFSLQNQIWAAHGFAVLYMNPRGSSGYGQKFSDGCVDEWGGGDYQDLMKGVDAVIAKYDWVDANRLGVTGGSYGGFMTNWVITQTDRFKVAVAVASVSNLISFYATSLYQDLIHAEFKGYPWENYDLLWKYSPIHYVKNVSTPTMFIHGEQDNDVHITQAEEMYTALRRHNIDAVLVRYPREGHGLREPLHRLDEMGRVLAWFDRYIKANVE